MPDVLDEFAALLRESHPEALGEVAGDPVRPRTARGYWRPVMARLYGIRPWEMGGLTVGEFAAIADDLEALSHG